MSHSVHTGTCHCGAVRFEVVAWLEPAERCNCARRTAVLVGERDGAVA